MAKKKYSGKFVVRVTPETHEALASAADKKFMSLNGLINSILEPVAIKSLSKSKEKVA